MRLPEPLRKKLVDGSADCLIRRTMEHGLGCRIEQQYPLVDINRDDGIHGGFQNSTHPGIGPFKTGLGFDSFEVEYRGEPEDKDREYPIE